MVTNGWSKIPSAKNKRQVWPLFIAFPRKTKWKIHGVNVFPGGLWGCLKICPVKFDAISSLSSWFGCHNTPDVPDGPETYRLKRSMTIGWRGNSSNRPPGPKSVYPWRENLGICETFGNSLIEQKPRIQILGGSKNGHRKWWPVMCNESKSWIPAEKAPKRYVSGIYNCNTRWIWWKCGTREMGFLATHIMRCGIAPSFSVASYNYGIYGLQADYSVRCNWLGQVGVDMYNM